MGAQGSKYLSPHLWREDEPDSHADIKYHPQFGFDAMRKPKVPLISEEEMDSANIPLELRDECAHIRIYYRGCIKHNGIAFWRCAGLREELNHCYFDEHIHDAKEFEREKRLNARERRIREKAEQ